MPRHSSTLTLCLAVVCACSLATRASAVTVSASAMAPTVNGADIANLSQATSFEDFGSGFEWPDRPARGQTFLTGGNVLGYTLDAVTVQTDRSTVGTGSYNVRVGTVSGSSFTAVATETGSFGGLTDEHYVTFQLDTPIVLTANTLYAFDIGMYAATPNSFGTVGWALRNNTGGYADGRRYSSGANGVGSATLGFHNPADSDRIFHVNLEAVLPMTQVPEPATAALGVLGVAGLLMRRRQSA